MRTTATLVLGLGLAAAILAGCGGASAAGPATPAGVEEATDTTPATDPTDGDHSAGGLCAFVDPGLASESIGGQPIDGGTVKHGDVFKGDGCVFRAIGSKVWVSVWATSGVSREDWDATQDETGASTGDPIEGLGEAAWRYVGSSTGLRVAAFDAGLAVTVQVSMPGIDAGASGPAEEIVRSVLLQLGG